MNDLPKWKLKLISWLIGDEPICLNFVGLIKNVPDGMSIVMIPQKGESRPAEQYSDKAFLVPIRNIKN